MLGTTDTHPCPMCAVRDANAVERYAHINRLRRFARHELQEAVQVIKSDMPKEDALDFLQDAIDILNEMQLLLSLDTNA